MNRELNDAENNYSIAINRLILSKKVLKDEVKLLEAVKTHFQRGLIDHKVYQAFKLQTTAHRAGLQKEILQNKVHKHNVYWELEKVRRTQLKVDHKQKTEASLLLLHSMSEDHKALIQHAIRQGFISGY